jgi:high-affinity K+ transport system ATPase subunit B
MKGLTAKYGTEEATKVDKMLAIKEAPVVRYTLNQIQLTCLLASLDPLFCSIDAQLVALAQVGCSSRSGTEAGTLLRI